MDREALLQVQPPPVFEGFEPFWRESYRRAREVAPEPRLSTESELRDGYRIHTVTFRAGDGRILGGWVAFPTEAEPEYAFIEGHGYGGRPAPGSLLGRPAVRIFPCARGFHRSAGPDVPDNVAKHVVHGIGSKETYVLGGCAMDLWAAVGVLAELAPGLPITYAGRSFGGGMGALAMPWEERVARVYLGQPSFGHYDFRLSVESRGSNAFVRAWVEAHPEAREVLRYFDAAIAAAFFKVPTFVSCSMFDPSVPPAGQFAVYNAIGTQKGLFLEPKGHTSYPEQAEVLARLGVEVRAWLEAAIPA